MINCSKIVLVVIWDDGLKYVFVVLSVFGRFGVMDLILVVLWGLFVFVGYVEMKKLFWVI